MPPKSFARAKRLLADRAELLDEPTARYVQDQVHAIDRELARLAVELVRLLEQNAPKLLL